MSVHFRLNSLWRKAQTKRHGIVHRRHDLVLLHYLLPLVEIVLNPRRRLRSEARQLSRVCFQVVICGLLWNDYVHLSVCCPGHGASMVWQVCN